MKRVRNEGDDKIDVEVSISVDVYVENESPKTLPIVVSSVNKTMPSKLYASMVVGKDMRLEGVAEEICDEEISLTNVDVRGLCGLQVPTAGPSSSTTAPKDCPTSAEAMFQVLREEDEVSGNEELEIVGASKKVESGVGKARAHGLTTTVQHKVAVKKHGNSPKDNTQILEVQDKDHLNFATFVSEKWDESIGVLNNLEAFTLHVSSWKSTIFGHIGRKKLSCCVGSVKSRCNWMLHRDRNTKFYHAFASSQHCANKVAGFRKDNREWCTNPGHLHVLASGFYKLLFTSSGADSSSYPIHGHFPSVEA
ncbi:hypothetical protein V6N13_139855 [Hibiscus sabdariffa]